MVFGFVMLGGIGCLCVDVVGRVFGWGWGSCWVGFIGCFIGGSREFGWVVLGFRVRSFCRFWELYKSSIVEV